ncbi:sensor histidine kinase [Corynebacterium epidermidicanis]|nr:histidine kinase [Corynebacterium epidermidicanis]
MNRPSTRDISVAAIALGLDLFGFLMSHTVAPATFSFAVSPVQFWLILLTIVAKASMLLWRRHFPVLVILGISAAELLLPLYCLVTGEQSLGYNGIAATVAAFSLALHTRSKTRDIALLVIAGLTIGIARAFTTPVLGDMNPTLFALLTALGWLLPLVVMFAIGLAVRNSRELTESLARQAELAERNAIIEERARIARELHDTTAHHLSAIAIQAQAARALIDVNPRASKEHLDHVTSSITKALQDVRATVGKLSVTDAEVSRVPQPTDLPALISEVRGLGQEVAFSDTSVLSGAERVAAYRITQEALTNARKHAAGAPVTVTLSDDELCVLTSGSFERGESGRGIISIQERAHAVGATAFNGPTADGWLVRIKWRKP